MKVIYKYKLESGPICLTKGAEILTIQLQNGYPYIWTLIDNKAEKDYKVLVILGTGQEMPENFDYKYIATFQQNTFVWHVFELNKN